MEIFKITKIDGDKRAEAEASVVREVPLTINLNDEELATLLCSPSGLKELTVGFLKSAGLIEDISDVKDYSLDDKNWRSWVTLKGELPGDELVFKRLYTSGCGRGVILYNAADLLYKNVVVGSEMRISAGAISNLMAEFTRKSELFRETGGVHSAALADKEKIIYFYDDIGRHNALDKVIGRALIDSVDLEDKIILLSGRMSSEIYHKTIKTGIPILVSRGAPTDQAVKLGQKNQMTIVGFARGDRMNVYSGEWRIT